MAQEPLLSKMESGQSFDCDDDQVQLPLWKNALEVDEVSNSSGESSESSSLLGDTIENEQVPSPKLPLALQASYLLCGLTLALPTLPMMYILNTKVPLPLSVLPTYGALSFMPYSFKPLYAYISSYFPRRILLPVGWATCACTTLLWMWVPSVAWVFFVGILSNTAMSWTSFLLGLTLVDTARAASLSSTSTSYDQAASVFQSQAATARNTGSLTASMLTCLIFGMDRSRNAATMNEGVVNGIFWATAACHGISLLLVLVCQESFAPKIVQTQQTTEGNIEEQPLTRRASYSALEMGPGEDEECPDLDSDTDSEDGQRPHVVPTSSFCNIGVLTIVVLQVCIILVALKSQVRSFLTEYPVLVPIIASFISLLTAFLLLRLKFMGANLSQELQKCCGREYRVGLVLILRHAVPNPSSVMYSFLYHCFQAQPVWLQIFSLVDNGFVTLSSWSYQKLFAAEFSQGRKLIAFMMITTLIANALGSLDALVVNNYKEGETMTLHSLFPWLVLGVKAASTFISEWNFLPSVVLATVSASTGTNQIDSSKRREASVETTEGEGEERAETLEPVLATNVMYGSLISCIDFGDQLGSMLSTPLVAALGISRENAWDNLDTLIYICSGIGVASAGLLFLLGRPSMDCSGRV